ncbi:MAG TPA: lysophospholipid acyltransferase family protein [Verrucomicrobiae bacterium]|jgi:1-acyl-sn-glycerol-3-phosphate acyltransferase
MKDTHPPKATPSLVAIQFLLGASATAGFALPYLRRAHGLGQLNPRQRYLFAVNHVSLLDTILMGSLCWRSRCYPILVLGDKGTWNASWLKRVLSSRIGFLLDRSKVKLGRIEELQMFGQASHDFHLVVFPEGTRGDGQRVGPCKPGLYYVANTAKIPIVPVFIENMEKLSTKTGPLNLWAGLRQVEVHFGRPIQAERYLPLAREEFGEFIRQNIEALRPLQSTECSNPALIRP